MSKFMPYAVLCGIVAIAAYFYYMPVAYIAGGICTLYFLAYFVVSKD